MNDIPEFLTLVVVAGVTIVFAIFVAAMIDIGKCSSRSERMGMRSSWGLIQGCMIEYKPGRWIHIDRYRAFDDDK